jgi:Cytochrome oxidase complex assembly protein 1
MRRVLSELRESEDVRTVLGDAVRPEPTWYLNGSPWVSGSVKMLQGNIDVSFRVKGHKGTHKFLLRTVASFLMASFFVFRMGKALARSTSRVSGENAEDLSQLVRIRFHLRFLHPPILLNRMPSSPLYAPSGPLICFPQCVSRSLQTMAR